MRWSLMVRKKDAPYFKHVDVAQGSIRHCLRELRQYRQRGFRFEQVFLMPSWFHPRLRFPCEEREPGHRGPHEVWQRPWWSPRWRRR